MDSGLRQNDERPSFWTAQKREVIQNPSSKALKFRMDSGLRQNDERPSFWTAQKARGDPESIFKGP
jgi:hypothetical protein